MHYDMGTTMMAMCQHERHSGSGLLRTRSLSRAGFRMDTSGDKDLVLGNMKDPPSDYTQHQVQQQQQECIVRPDPRLASELPRGRRGSMEYDQPSSATSSYSAYSTLALSNQPHR